MIATNFTLKDSKESIGNILRASKDLNPRDVVLTEPPLLVGPNHRSNSVCLECLTLLVSESEKCPKCQWSLCKKCQNIEQSASEKLTWHRDGECEMLRKSNFCEQIYEAIFPLRLVNEALSTTHTWQKLMNLQHHCDLRLKSPDWNIFHQKVVLISHHVLELCQR